MDLIVLTPDKKVFEGKVSRIVVPGTLGQFEVLDNHTAIVSSLGLGIISILTEEKNTIDLPISAGFIEVLDNKVSLLVQEGTEALTVELVEAED